jgi:LacI family transcriptional regulator
MTAAADVVRPRPATARDVARLAGVSRMTVSNVLNHPSRVTPETAAKVTEAVVALDFLPIEPARRIRAGRSRVLGVVVANLRDPDQAGAARAISELAAGKGLLALLADSRRSPDHQRRHIGVFQQQQARAILVLPVAGSTEWSGTAGPVPIRVVLGGPSVLGEATDLLESVLQERR